MTLGRHLCCLPLYGLSQVIQHATVKMQNLLRTSTHVNPIAIVASCIGGWSNELSSMLHAVMSYSV